jgi:RHS repeat-associated protein
LGRDGFQQNAGDLVVRADAPSLALATPAALQAFTNSSVICLYNGQELRQALTPEVLADIVTNNDFSYTINFYTSDQILPYPEFRTIDSFYVTDGSPPYCTFEIQNPDASTSTYNRLRVNQSGSLGTHQFDYVWNSGAQRWDLTTGGGLRTETRTKNWDSTQTILTETNIILNADSSIAFKQIEIYQSFPWGETNLISRIVDPDGAWPQTNTWTYYTNSSDTANYSHLEQITEPSGYWENYSYDSFARMLKKVAQYQDVATNAADSLCRVTTFTYATNANNYLEETIAETLLGQEIKRSYRIYYSGGVTNIVCQTPGADVTNSDNLITVSTDYTSGSFQGRTHLVQNPDGTIQVYQYLTTSNTEVTTLFSGAPDSTGTNVADGTKTVTAENLSGNAISNATYDVASGGVLISSAVTLQTDTFGRPTLVQYNDGTMDQRQYGCCGLESETNREGITTTYTYDDLKRVSTMATTGIATLYTYDAAGRVLTTTRQGTDTSQILESVDTYNTAGWMTASTNALNYGTTYTNALDANRHTVKTTTYPDNSTRIETYFEDGSLASVTGTAVHGLRYVYGVEQDGGISRYYTKEIKLNTNGTDASEWTKTYTDAAGRAYKSVFADNAYAQSFYNNQGQLTNQVDPDGVSTLYVYNSKGEQAITAVDMNQDTIINFAGNDRITMVTNDVTTDNGTNVNRSRTYVWETSADSPTLAATSETSVEGLQRWNITWNNGIGVTNHSVTAYDGVGGQFVTNTAPDGSFSVSIYEFGRLMSVTNRDSASNQIAATSYGYDPQGRETTVTDARNGTTTMYCNNADQATNSVTPSPDGVLPGQSTTVYFDSMGRVTQTTLPDSTSTTNFYYSTGELELTVGSRTYPVEYTYDYAGRMKTMQTWTNYPAGNTATTTWNYDPLRGFLTNKTYDGGSPGPSYTYTAAGRLKTRLWARGITSTYGYDAGGDLQSVAYSDGTAGRTNGFDRLGRNTAVTNGATVCLLTYNDTGGLLTESYSGGPLNGLTVTNVYDSLLRRTNLVLRSTAGILTSTTYGYDAASRLYSVGDGTNSATYSYVANSPLVSQIHFTNGSTLRMTTTKSYDFLNRLSGISSLPSASSAINTSYGNNSANQRTSVTNGDGSFWIYQYDNLSQVKSGKKYWSDGTLVAGQQFEYGFDTIGNRKSASTGGDASGANLRAANYSVNSRNQYTQRDVPGYADIQGSANTNALVTVNGEGAFRKGAYFREEIATNNNSSSVWLGITNVATLGSGTTTPFSRTNIGNLFLRQTPEQFGYDADGNLTNDGRFVYAWDAENRLTNITSHSTAPIGSKIQLNFVYDYQGRRVQKTVLTNNGSTYFYQYTNNFAYDGWNLIAIVNPQSSIVQSFEWGLDLSGGVGGLLFLNDALTISNQPSSHLVTFDGNGNVDTLVNASSGVASASYGYGPFGELVRVSGPMAKPNHFLFSTKIQDDETDLIYYGYRYYNASTGRWISRDPVGEAGGMNTYDFVNNDALTHIELTGTDFIDNGYYTVFSMFEGQGATIPDFEIEAKCQQTTSKFLFFRCTRCQLKLTTFSLSVVTRISLYHLSSPVTTIRPWRIPRLSDTDIEHTIEHEQIHREHWRAWYDANLPKAESDFQGTYSCRKCSKLKKELKAKWNFNFDSFNGGEHSHAENHGWHNYTVPDPEYAPPGDWWNQSPPYGDQPFSDPEDVF